MRASGASLLRQQLGRELHAPLRQVLHRRAADELLETLCEHRTRGARARARAPPASSRAPGAGAARSTPRRRCGRPHRRASRRRSRCVRSCTGAALRRTASRPAWPARPRCPAAAHAPGRARTEARPRASARHVGAARADLHEPRQPVEQHARDARIAGEVAAHELRHRAAAAVGAGGAAGAPALGRGAGCPRTARRRARSIMRWASPCGNISTSPATSRTGGFAGQLDEAFAFGDRWKITTRSAPGSSSGGRARRRAATGSTRAR